MSNLSAKIVLLGEGGVGKTSLRRRYLGEGFKKNYTMTIGSDFAAKNINIDGNTVLATIWDLSGQDKFKTIRESYYSGISGALLIFDVSNRETHGELNKWIKELYENNKNKMVPLVIIGNKIDLREEGVECMTYDEGYQAARAFGELYGVSFSYIETSAKTGDNVTQAFNALVREIYEEYQKILEEEGLQ